MNDEEFDDVEDEEEEDDYIEEDNIHEQFQDQPKADNKGKNLRQMLDRIKESKPKTPVVEQNNSSERDSDEAYNSDTFGEVKKPMFTGRRQKVTPFSAGSSNKSDNTDPKLGNINELSEIDSNGEDVKEEIELPDEKIILPNNLIKISNEKPYEKIVKLITEAENARDTGRPHKFETSKAKLLRMCDEAEAYRRQGSRDLSIFEMDPENTDLSVIDREKPPQVKPEWAVKIFKRSAADVKLNDPETIRPIPLITMVLDYLLDEIADVDRKDNVKFMRPKTGKITFAEIYVFLFDRTRAIRQELIILNESTRKDHIQLLEKIARFHCLAANEGLDLH